MMIERGTLLIGLTVDGVRHTEFELRPATVGDNVEAIEELGNANGLRLSAAIYARQIVRLGSLPKSNITTDLVLALAAPDYDALEQAQERLKKRLLGSGLPWSGGTPVGPGASAEASPSTTPSA